jgi:hypothetical protein
MSNTHYEFLITFLSVEWSVIVGLFLRVRYCTLVDVDCIVEKSKMKSPATMAAFGLFSYFLSYLFYRLSILFRIFFVSLCFRIATYLEYFWATTFPHVMPGLGNLGSRCTFIHHFVALILVLKTVVE